MLTLKGSLLAAAICTLALQAGISRAQVPDDDTAARAARWQTLQQAIFGDRAVRDGAGVIELDAPPRALDAALVPVGLRLVGDKPVKALYLVIDNNPSPLSAHITFGPLADPRSLTLRVRVNEYTLMHAVAETQDGTLYLAEKFVKAAGGCSAPAGSSTEQALKEIGRMKLRLLSDFEAGKPLQAQLMIRHPNFNGMQMDQITRYYTPARFIRTTEVTYEGSRVFHLESDISISSDPVIVFGFVPQAKGKLKVVVRDTDDETFAHTFDVPAPAS
ncbi:MAG TPA: quinoprotein dehydrogenase-associated SoxYZ-like carrier [Steroidobacteraceae bacterium]|nr:quinoprotein dehydrogenase-associated SoxYZ-like carrier [Steroidobacteraceae bacterium]